VTTPRLRRRLLCMIYEALLVFGIIFFADLLFDLLTQSRHALAFRTARQIWLFFIIGAYFVFFWHRKGQTLAMKTWHLQLTNATYQPISWQQAVVRYMLAWFWFLPAILLAYALHLKIPAALGLIAIGMLLWALCIFFDKDRQFLHDKLAGTRLVIVPPAAKKPNKEAD
jgi:uncharacterized RDD family membrane protein YckC